MVGGFCCSVRIGLYMTGKKCEDTEMGDADECYQWWMSWVDDNGVEVEGEGGVWS